MELNAFQSRLKSVNWDELFNRAVLENKETILDANTAQLEQGKFDTGQSLPEYKIEDYAAFKKALGSQAPFGVPDLKVEGDFYSGFFMEVGFGKNFAIGSDDEKAGKLEKQYGFGIYGIPEDKKEDIYSDILETMLNLIRHELLR